MELAIYRTVPHTLALRPGDIRVPTGAIVGRDTDTVMKRQYLRMKRRLGFDCQRVPGTHMFPLEYPLDTAEHIDAMIGQLHARRAA